ncbi:hypothetical protein C4565_00950 [Candidatus Parcubacteria bacterium]|jgi:type IV secretory pathway VirB4 component|nr:MAG: hypothetical protein C4565_00950 [Candidatus Parcubacteria bacterium]
MAEVNTPTQKFVEISEIKDGIVYLKDGGIRRILIVSGINFDLKSDAEQNLILGSFQNFLNTIDYPTQLFIHSRKVNVDSYLDKMRERREQEENELLKIQIDEYINFIKTLVDQNAIISKTFFVVIPYEGIVNTPSFGVLSSLFGSQKSRDAEAQATLQSKLEQLEHRVIEVKEGLEQIGLHVSELNDEELTELFYNLYNPQLIEKKDLQIAKK